MEGAAYRPPLPAPGDQVTWPDDFGQRFTIFVDTEEEFDWSAPLRRESRSVAAMAALPTGAARFAEAGAALALLIDYPVATDPAAIDHLHRALDYRRHAVGTQLHAWVNPPYDEPLTRANSYAGNLPPALEAAKLQALTVAITQAFGQPRLYRAGRYGIGPATLRLLADYGY
ncbi:MAG TPA: WalW protein, partial [Sphingomonas sp.]|nr:WalW protein [Sphingomonas sp.]